MLKYGLPQGSVGGPLGFILYTHVIGHILRLHNLNYHLYADDIQIGLYQIVDPKIPGDVACAIFKLTQNINYWMANNKLKLNPKKTESCCNVFCSSQAKSARSKLTY